MRIPGLPGEWVRVVQKYDYDKDKSRCGVCGGLGFPWHGWFSCDDCDARSLVETGETFIPQDYLKEVFKCNQ